ncbi:MAG: Rrf2 family transcriptional regulator [Gemmatimonadaceae bacterium]
MVSVRRPTRFTLNPQPVAMLLSRRCEYALRTVLYLATRIPDAPIPVREISGTLAVPHAFLAKTVRELVRARIVRTQPGTGGGISLARPAGDITLKDVVLAIDGPEIFDTCVLRLPGCGVMQACPMHEVWVPTRDRIERMLQTATLATVADSVHANKFRLSDFVTDGT